MAATMKHWRDSASLIIASRRFAVKQPKQTLVNKVLRKKPQPIENKNEELLRTLLLKRSGQSNYMPSVYVFPGGMVDDTDFSSDWLSVLDSKYLTGFDKSYAGSPIFSARESESAGLASGVGLRITAIRETFEESGILIARPRSDLLNENPSYNSDPSYATVCNLPQQDAIDWRLRIHSEPSLFVTMCKQLDMVPDIWSLYEWSNWLTPPLQRSRFDTAFFLCCVDEAPEISDSNETEHGMWSSPQDALKDCSDGSVTLAPPQVYEISRLTRFESVDELLAFAWKRASSYGLHRWMPVIYSCPDGMVFALPGDDLYPEYPDYTGTLGPVPIVMTETFEELQKLYPNHHRAVFHKDKSKSISLYCNIQFVDGQILPLQYNSSSEYQPKY